MSGDPPPADASAFESARPEADLEGRLVLEAMRGALFGEKTKPVTVGRYELIERLGAGALGLVVAARDPELDRRVAIKLLPARVDSRKLLREARALARLSSPHIVSILDVGTYEPEDIGTLFGGDPGDPAGTGVWLAMELVEGTPLDQWGAQGPRPWQEVLEVYREAGQGLAEAHGSRIVHRDFKPANVILGHDNRVRVVDFGLARSPNLSFMTSADAAAAADDAALLRGLIGTPAYMAPEQHKGEEAGERADQYAFCVSLFEALYGDLPYPGPRYEDFTRQKTAGTPQFPTEPAVPAEIRRALERGLDPDPEQRFESVDTLLEALRVSQEDTPRANGRWVAGGLLAAGVVGAAWLVSSMEPECSVPTADPSQWEAQTASAVSALSASEVPYAKVAAFRAQEVFDARIEAWTEARRAACEVDELPPDREQCLVRAHRGLGAALEHVVALEGHNIANLEAVLDAVPDPAECAAAPRPAPGDQASDAVDLRHRLLVSQLDVRSGDVEAGRGASDTARTTADKLGFAPLSAEAALVAADNAWRAGDFDAAVAAATDAHELAEKADYVWAVSEAAALGLRVAAARGDDQLSTWFERADAAQGEGTTVVDLHLARAAAHAAQGKADDAIASYKAALSTDAIEAAPARTLRALGGLAHQMLAASRPDEAAEPAERALGIAESVFGPGHPKLVGALTTMGRVERARGRYADAESRLRRALELRDASGATEDRELGMLLLVLAEVKAEQGQGEEARQLLERAGALGEDRPPGVLAALCRVLLQQRDLEAAQQQCEAALEQQTARVPRDAESELTIEDMLGCVLLEKGDLEAAETRLEGALERAQKSLGPGHPKTAPLIIDLARLRKDQARPDDAVALLDRVVALAGTLGASHPDVVTAVVRRSAILAETKRADEALADVRAHAEKAGAELSPADRFELSFAEAVAQWHTGAKEEARTSARAARQEYAKSTGARQDRLARVDAWLAER